MNVERAINRYVYSYAPQLRDLIARRVLLRESRRQSALAVDWGIQQKANWHDIGNSMRSSTVYILGNGPSINQLDEGDFDAFLHHFTIGLNWRAAHHWFMPDIVTLELNTSTLWYPLVDKINSTRPRLVLSAQHLPQVSETTLDQVPIEIADRVRYCTVLPMTGQTPSAYAQSIRDFVRFGSEDGCSTGPSRTSLERIIVSAAIMGAKDIVLVGIDLEGPLFYKPGAEKLAHRTAEGRNFRNNVALRIPILQATLQRLLGVNLWLHAPVGRLRQVLQVHANK